MAHLVENLGIAHPKQGVSSLFGRISEALAKRRVYKRTYAELSQLSTRELDDLGISRSMISRLAREAAERK